jgi:hypothetical protein
MPNPLHWMFAVFFIIMFIIYLCYLYLYRLEKWRGGGHEKDQAWSRGNVSYSIFWFEWFANFKVSRKTTSPAIFCISKNLELCYSLDAIFIVLPLWIRRRGYRPRQSEKYPAWRICSIPIFYSWRMYSLRWVSGTRQLAGLHWLFI